MLFPLPPLEVTAASILSESTVANLARPQNYRTAQSSSYDRRSKTPGTADWFANEDWGKYLRTETNEGRTEHVMAELRGPGALVHQWSANPNGTWRFYFDGETTPRLSVQAKDLREGRFGPLGDPFAYTASRGFNVYFPFPYARSLKVTTDASDGDPLRMYYLLMHRTYPGGTAVRTFMPEDLQNVPAGPTALQGGPESFVNMDPTTREQSVAPGASRVFHSWNGARTIRRLDVAVDFPPVPDTAAWGDPRRRHNILRNLVLEAEFDGERCVSVPVADLFGSPPFAAPYATTASAIFPDGTMRLELPMPFHRAARLSVKNFGRVAVPVRMTALVTNGAPPSDALLFHAQFRAHSGKSRPFRDMPVVNLRGRGHYVGTVLHVANPHTAWWGEGDEKVRVDNEAFPSIFGTGTEDYFAYAWSSNQPFMRPYHAQPQVEPRGNAGQIANLRWHILDPIPYSRSLTFDLEQWHWVETESRFATTGFWYAAPGGTSATPLKREDLTILEVIAPKPEPDAFQGEALTVAEKTGGETEIQAGFGELVDSQLWWRDAKQGGRLVLQLPNVPAGRYRVEMRACLAPDYGRHELRLSGKSLGVRDFYSTSLAWRRYSLGTVTLGEGSPTLAVTVQTPNPKAEPRNMFGLDWIKLVRVR